MAPQGYVDVASVVLTSGDQFHGVRLSVLQVAVGDSAPRVKRPSVTEDLSINCIKTYMLLRTCDI